MNKGLRMKVLLTGGAGFIGSNVADRLIGELKASADPRVLGNGDRFDTYPYYGGTPKYPGFYHGK